MIATQLVRASGGAIKASSAVAAGEALVIRRPARAEPPCPRTFGIVHTDARMYVIDKPAGLPVHASAKFYFNTLTRVLDERFPGEDVQICHRLDRETSGCLAVARDREAAAALKGAFEAKRVRKHYLAVVHGQPPWPDAPPSPSDDDREAVLDAPLRVAVPERSGASSPACA